MLAIRATKQAKAGLALGLTMACAVMGTSFAMAQPVSAVDHLPRDIQAHYKKVWGDEFDGNKLDTTKWAVPTGCFDLASGMEGRFRTDMVRQYGGKLHLLAQHDKNGKPCQAGHAAFSTGMVNSHYLSDWKDKSVAHAWGPGTYYEASIKLPEGNKNSGARATWASFWLTSTTFNWPASGELDVFESRGYDPSWLQANIHTQPRQGSKERSHQHQHVLDRNIVGNTQTAFHTYGVLNKKDGTIEFYYDGHMVHRVTPDDANWPFAKAANKLFIRLNHQVGGLNEPYKKASPKDYEVAKDMQVDYVRVYQEKTAADKPQDAVVSVPDWRLRNKLNQAIAQVTHTKRGDAQPMLASDLEKLTTLDLSARDGAESWEKIKNLEGIQHTKNLTFISLKNTEVKDLTPLNNLKKLKSVELSWPLTINR